MHVQYQHFDYHSHKENTNMKKLSCEVSKIFLKHANFIYLFNDSFFIFWISIWFTLHASILSTFFSISSINISSMKISYPPLPLTLFPFVDNRSISSFHMKMTKKSYTQIIFHVVIY